MTTAAPELPKPAALARRLASIFAWSRTDADGEVRRGIVFGSLARHIMAINLLVLAVPIAGVFYLNRYQDSLILSQLASLRVQTQILAGAFAADEGSLDRSRSEDLLRRLAAPTAFRARLFDATGALAADASGRLAPHVEASGAADGEREPLLGRLLASFASLFDWLVGQPSLPLYVDKDRPTAADYFEAARALAGESAFAVRADDKRGLLLSIAVPIQRDGRTVGAIMAVTPAADIENQLRAVRVDILKLLGITLAVTVLLSLYLGGTIARPIRRLARAAERVRRSKGHDVELPDFTHRNDEIGELSRSLKEMTEALWRRVDAIEAFAADVAHEIKNPLSSMRSAVETAARVEDAGQRKKLMAIVLDDVQRLNRLISDVSEASRLDSELSRQKLGPVELRSILDALVAVESASLDDPDAPRLSLGLPARDRLAVRGVEARLGQVFRNVIQNALSFSPERGRVVVRAERGDGVVRVMIDDEGPGIPEGKLEAVFDRFYSDRPRERASKFGIHSGLGLSISRQIVEACGGRIWAENRTDGMGRVDGARFVVELIAAA